ncbi:MAG: putative Se/S carrier-like protein [Thermodesulfobacteriota bacterium]|nr:putative Se/S carrier-like protein [Thermodesulfobacteriota bacterium]
MSFSGFFKQKRSETGDNQNIDRGILVFENTSEVIRAESVLKSEGWKIKVVGPPPEIRTGCDLVIEIPLIEELNILRTLEKAGVSPLETVPVSSPLLQPVDLFQNKDFGKYLMIRAANMKLTIDKETLNIVNVSGGGCPDVPYLAQEMVGKTMAEAPAPREIGHTLCGYALQLAYEEILRRCSL